MVNILIGCTGSVATIKLPLLIETLQKQFLANEVECVVSTLILLYVVLNV